MEIAMQNRLRPAKPILHGALLRWFPALHYLQGATFHAAKSGLPDQHAL